jgi:hypothetical protein
LPDDFWEQAPRGSPFMKFALIILTTLIVLAILAFVGLRVFQARQHHLAEGYLFQGPGQLLYFHVQESFFWGRCGRNVLPGRRGLPIWPWRGHQPSCLW